MGAYLSSPVKDKESGEGYDGRFEYGVCAMQGWRTDMVRIGVCHRPGGMTQMH